VPLRHTRALAAPLGDPLAGSRSIEAPLARAPIFFAVPARVQTLPTRRKWRKDWIVARDKM
jgi:hypothetical protein